MDKIIAPTRREMLLRDYAIMRFACIGKFGDDCKAIEFDVSDRIPIGDCLEISEIRLDFAEDIVCITLKDADGWVNSFTNIECFSDDIIETIIEKVYGEILCA